MAAENPLIRTARGLIQAISVCPPDADLRSSLLALLAPLYSHWRAAAPSTASVVIERYQEQLQQLYSFTDEVIGLFPASHSARNPAAINARLTTLDVDARNLHSHLEGRGLFTAFAPSFAQQRAWDRIVQCFSQPPGPGLERDPLLNRESVCYEALFRSLSTYLSCVETLLDTECKMHHLADAFLRFISSMPVLDAAHVDPPTNATYASPDPSRFARLYAVVERYEANLRKAPVSKNDADEIAKLFQVLRFTGYNFQDKLTFTLSPSSIRFPSILGATSRSVIYPASLLARDDFLNAIWNLSVVVKVFIPDDFTLSREMHYRQEALRILTLSHPCLLTVHDTQWPEEGNGQIHSDIFVIAEQMSYNLRKAISLPPFQPALMRIRVLLDVAGALVHLHKSGIAYKELVPENILVRLDRNEWCGYAKVDLTTLLKQALFPKSARTPEDSLYVPPEAFRTQDVYYTGDVWSIGILMCFLFSRNAPSWPAPLGNAAAPELKGKILWQTAQSWCSEIDALSLRKIASQCLHLEPAQRPTSVALCSLLSKALTSPLNPERIQGAVHEEVIGGENHKDGHFDEVVLDSSNGLGAAQVEIGFEEEGANRLSRRRSGSYRPRRSGGQSPKDPDWSSEKGAGKDLGSLTPGSSSGDEEGSRRKQQARRAKRKQVRYDDMSADDVEPSHYIESADQVAAVSKMSPGISHSPPVENGFGAPDYQTVLNQLPSLEKSTNGLDGQSAVPALESVLAAKLPLLSEDDPWITDNARQGQDSADARSDRRTEAEKQNSLAQSILESQKPGCLEKAAKMFQQAADAGSAKAKVNYGHCLEQGRGVQQDYCQAALYFQEAAKQGDARGQFKIGLCHELGKGTKKDFKVAVEWYSRAAEQGDSKAQANLGMALEHGRGVKKDLHKAIEYYRRAANSGNSVAQLNMGVMYENGRGVPADEGEAVKLYERAAEGGNNRAMLNLALCYENGRGVKKDMIKGALMHIKAADKGNAEAQFRAGEIYEKGQGLKKDVVKAAGYYQFAAEQDHIPAMCNLGILYEEGRGMLRDETKAFRLFKAASEQSHAPSTFRLASCYEKGIGVKKSPTLAVSCYKDAARQGSAAARVALGYMYENGEGVKKSVQDAVRMYRQAAAAGNAAGEAALGQCHFFAYGMPKNLSEAVRLYESASAKGNEGACVDLGIMYRDGTEVKQDSEKAVALFKRAADRGHALAEVHLGESFYYGRGVAKDFDKAKMLFERAAKKGEAEGYRWLGDLYAEGHGVQLDMTKAVDYFQRGAAAGSHTAQTNLGNCYESGQGVEVNGTKAINLYRKAADSGNTTAMNNLGILYEKGKFVKQDYGRAFKLYRKAVDNDGIEALCNLADCYAEGNGVEKDQAKAVRYYTEGADNGLPEAQCELGTCYYYGRGVQVNHQRAVELFRSASESEPEALRYLGIAHYDGSGLPQDDKKAMEYFSEAANRGNHDACLEIGNCFELGRGVGVDHNKAAEYYQKAVDGGNKTAMMCLGSLYFSGQGVEQSDDKALELCERAEPFTWEDMGK